MENGNGYDFLLRKLSESMKDGAHDGYLFGAHGLDRRDTHIQCECSVDKEGSSLISGMLVLESKRQEPAAFLVPLFSFRRKAGKKGWHLKCDEKLVSHWLWNELVRLERRDGLCELSEAEKDLILEDNINQL